MSGESVQVINARWCSSFFSSGDKVVETARPADGEAACVGTLATLACLNILKHVGPGTDASDAGPAHGHRARR